MRRTPRHDWFGLTAFQPGARRTGDGAVLYLLERVDSTSDFLLGRGEGGMGRVCEWDGWGWRAEPQRALSPPPAAPAGSVAVARRQTQGRGRMGRGWTSLDGLMMSWLVPPVPARGVTGLAVWAGLIAATVLREEFGLPVDLKWPNDLSVDGRKLGGLLLDAVRSPRGPLLVAGLGLNLGATSATLPLELRGKATSFRMVRGRHPLPGTVAGAMLARFDAELPGFRADGWSPWLRRFAACDALRGRVVSIATHGGEWRGRAVGIDETGALLLRRVDGRIMRVLAGDAHVTGVAAPVAGRRNPGARSAG